jgi:hypothetical protein
MKLTCSRAGSLAREVRSEARWSGQSRLPTRIAGGVPADSSSNSVSHGQHRILAGPNAAENNFLPV